MINYKLVNAEPKDIEILTSMKLLTMIDDNMDKKLSYKEKNKIKQNIIKNIEESFEEYKLIYVNKKLAGAYSLNEYKDGAMIDELYLFEEFRNQGIGTDIINRLKEKVNKLYVWVYKANKGVLRLFRSAGFMTEEENERVIILKYDSLHIKVTEELDKIRLGYMDRKGNKYVTCDEKFRDLYYLQTPHSVMENGIGLCFDQVELERYLVSKMGINHRTYFMSYQKRALGPAHTFLLFKENDKYYWFENAWYKYKGIHEYDTKEEALLDIKKKFVATIDDYDESKFRMYEFDKPRAGINYTKYIGNAMNGIVIKLNEDK